MAFLPTVLNGGGAGETFLADASAFTTTSVTFTSGALGLVVVESSKGGAPDTPTITGWTQVATTTNGAGRRVTVFRNNSPSSGTVTADFGGVTQTGAVIAVIEIASGWNTTTPITQSKTASGTSGTATVTLDATPAASALVVTALALQLNTAVTPDGAYTEIVDLGHGSPVQRLHVAYDVTSASASVSHTFSSTDWGIAAVEIAAAAAGTTLTVADATHAHTADGLTLTQTHVLTVADSGHGHVADNLALTQVHSLTVADAAHAHAVDNVTLTQTHVLAVDDAAHGHTADNVSLSTAGELGIAETVHAHTADSMALTQQHQLAADDAVHAHTADNVALTQVHVLSVSDATHGHTADGVALGQTHVLVVAEGLHGHLADIVVLEVGGAVVNATSASTVTAGVSSTPTVAGGATSSSTVASASSTSTVSDG